MDEKNIIARCLNGEGEAFEMMVSKYQSQILHFAWNILGDKDEAKDVTQDSFLRSYLGLPGFDMEKSFKTWLYAIAYNRCMDKIREKRSRMSFIDKAKSEPWLSGKMNRSEKRFEDSEHFGSILQKLNEKERSALSLRLNEGYLSREIAEILGCKESTVRVYILNAKRKIKRILEKTPHV